MEGSLDFLQAIADECGIGGPAGSREAFRHRFEQFVDDAGSRNKRVLLVVDEVQSLSRELIPEIRHLSNVGTDRSTCLNVLLVGQNELNAILSEPENGALKERIRITGTAAPLTEPEVRQYVQHRLRAKAGLSPHDRPCISLKHGAISREHAMERTDLVLRITERLTAGTLPCVDCVVTWSGPGRGRRPCAVCDQQILQTDIETECDLPGGETIFFHRACYLLWNDALPKLPA